VEVTAGGNDEPTVTDSLWPAAALMLLTAVLLLLFTLAVVVLLAYV